MRYSGPHRIAKGLTVEFTWTGDGRIECVWSPDVPKRLTGSALRRYHAARDAFALELAESCGGVLVVVET